MEQNNSLHDNDNVDAFMYWHQKNSTEIKNELLWDDEDVLSTILLKD